MDDAPRRDELMPIGGEWSGLLFENPQVGYDLRLTWTLTFEFGPVRREYGTTRPSLTIDWVPFDGAGWNSLVGHHVSSDRFGEPIEATVYFFEHYRYRQADVRVLEQRAEEVRAGARVRGDIDGLGLEVLEADQYLRFRGIYVQPSVLPDSTRAAASLLSEFTDISGLVGSRREHNYLFTSPDRS